MSDFKCARILIEAADKDMAALRSMGDVAAFADEIFGFHARQAAEKSFKAWLALLGEIYPLTHDLQRLLERLMAREPEAGRFGALTDMTSYAARFRYIGQDAPAGSLDRQGIVEDVGTLLEEVRRRLTSAEG